MTPDTGGGDPAGGLVARLGGERRFIPVAHVVEVIREAVIIRIPGSGPAVAGLMNHRGRILTVADATAALGIDPAGGPTGAVVVVSWGARRFGLAVDAVVELLAETRTGLAEIDLARIAAALFA